MKVAQLIRAALVISVAHGSAAIIHGQVDSTRLNAKADEPQVVAVVNGRRVITRTQVDDLIGSQLFSLQDKIYSLRKSVIENLLTQIVLEEEAKSRGMTLEQLKEQLVPEKVTIPQSHIDQAYADNITALGNMSQDEARQRIKIDLESQEKLKRYKQSVAELRGKFKVDVLLSPPIAPTVKVNGNGPSIGREDAPVVIIEFSDFQCPYCRQAAATLKQVVESYGDKVRIVFKHMPLAIHPEAFKASQASVCAGNQSKFWQFHDLLFKESDLSTGALRKYAAGVGLRVEEFDACMQSDGSRAAVLKDMQEARMADVQGTPTFIINGKVMRGAIRMEDFARVIDREIKERAGPRN